MADSVDDFFHKHVLAQVAKEYQMKPEEFHLLSGGYENYIYSCEINQQQVVMRWTPDWRRSPHQICAEVDWIQYLAQHKIPVADIISSPHGQPYDVFDIDNYRVSVVFFRNLLGRQPVGSDFKPRLVTEWGKIIGKLHSVTKDYHPPNAQCKRYSWDQDEFLNIDYVPEIQIEVRKRYDDLIAIFQNLPRSRDNYGLIHADLQHINLRLHNNSLSIFDFDDCQYNWFIMDIATPLYFALWEPHPNQNNYQYAEYFLQHFIHGYTQENTLDENWQEFLPTALKLIEMGAFILFNKDYRHARSVQDKETLVKLRPILTQYKKNIQSDIPYLESAYCPWV